MTERCEGFGPNGFADMVRNERAFVERVLAKHGMRGAELEDARQEVFLAAGRKLHTFEGRSTLRTWLYRVCANVASDLRRRAQRREARMLAWEETASAEPNPHDGLASRELASLIEEGLATLTPTKRAVLVMHDVEQLSVPEIAARLGCPVKTAFSRLYAARRELRAYLEERSIAPAWLAAVFAIPPSPWLRKLGVGAKLAALVGFVLLLAPSPPDAIAAPVTKNVVVRVAQATSHQETAPRGDDPPPAPEVVAPRAHRAARVEPVAAPAPERIVVVFHGAPPPRISPDELALAPSMRRLVVVSDIAAEMNATRALIAANR